MVVTRLINRLGKILDFRRHFLHEPVCNTTAHPPRRCLAIDKRRVEREFIAVITKKLRISAYSSIICGNAEILGLLAALPCQSYFIHDSSKIGLHRNAV